MKKGIALVVLAMVAALAFALVGCGGQQASSGAKSESAASVSNASASSANLKTVDFTNSVIVDDENVKIELVKFFESYDFSDGDAPNNFFTLSVTNKSDKSISISIFESYLADEKATIDIAQPIDNLLPGKKGSYTGMVWKESMGGVNRNPIDSFDDLYTLDGEITVQFMIDHVIHSDLTYVIPFDFSQYK